MEHISHDHRKTVNLQLFAKSSNKQNVFDALKAIIICIDSSRS